MKGFYIQAKAAIIGTALITLQSCMSSTPDADQLAAASDVHSQMYQPYALEPDGRVERVIFTEYTGSDGLRSFTLESSQAQRDDKPGQRMFSESRDFPRVYSGGMVFDSLYAMAVDDMRLLSVSDIRDSQYNDGKAIPCDCFETGEKWTYVWTRDLAYAADLSMADIAPQRVVNSLLFKTSPFRDGVTVPAGLPVGAIQIIQDTGSGGSWPVSTDRVSWAIAAERVLDNLSGRERAAFADQAYAALRGTIEADRQVAFDQQVGLYGGEQSFLDWRVQTYPHWINSNLSRMSSSKSLSTNVGHYRALKLAARLAAEHSDSVLAQKYSGWAEDLKTGINRIFWLNDVGQYASLTSSSENLVPVYKYDMLGSALAILSGIASEEQAEQIMAGYPHGEFGVPVYYPQQPNMYVYHNRAIWPFVTAYALKAAAQVRNDKVADNAIQSLMRGAALNLSNMENLEWLTAKPWFDNGPAINSRRQLWSVAGYLGMVQRTVFGYQVVDDGIVIDPFLTAATRKLMGESATATIKGISYQGHPLAIELALPAVSASQGYYEVEGVELNGRPVSGKITSSMLNRGNNHIRVLFGDLVSGSSQITMIPKVNPLSHSEPRVFSPEAPEIKSLDLVDGRLQVSFEDGRNQLVDGIHYNVYRNGESVAQAITRLSWREPFALASGQRYCYAVEAVFTGSGNRSHHSEPRCYEQDALQVIPITDPRVASNLAVTPAGQGLNKPALVEWGKPGDTLRVDDIQIGREGRYGIQVVYNNRQHTIDSGVTAAVKLIRIVDANNQAMAQVAVQMPNVEDRDGRYPLRTSTEAVVELKPGSYSLDLLDYFNMSYLESNSTYNAAGGQTGPVNTSSIAEFRIVYLGN